MALGISLLQGPRLGWFLMSEVPLSLTDLTGQLLCVQGYLALKKTPTPL